MSRDDPFRLSEDRERTRIRLVNSPLRHPPGPTSPTPPIDRKRAHPNPLVNAFAPLLEFAPELESALPPENPEALRARLYDELIQARDAVVAAGSPLARADQAAWLVAALLDDLALNTPWGGTSAWPRQPLVVMLHGDVDAGAQFYARLEELERHPNRDRELLELQYYCMALGFRGKYRVPGRAGDRSINVVRMAAARFLRDPDAEGAPLSPNWKGVTASDEPSRFTVPIWVMAAGTAVFVTIVYAVLSTALSSRAVELAALVRSMPPASQSEIVRPPPAKPAAAPPPVKVELKLLPEFEATAPVALRPALKGHESVSLATLVIQATNPEVFESSRAELTDSFQPLIASIAKVIIENKDVIGNVTVVGHTDSVPLQRSNPLSNNQRLSEARAQTIADLLVRYGVSGGRVRSEGRAATQPIADDGTREGRALNRRVEILVEKRL